MSTTRLIINHEVESRYERDMLNELMFWGVHTFLDVWWSAACGRCGHVWNEALHNGEVSTFW